VHRRYSAYILWTVALALGVGRISLADPPPRLGRCKVFFERVSPAWLVHRPGVTSIVDMGLVTANGTDDPRVLPYFSPNVFIAAANGLKGLVGRREPQTLFHAIPVDDFVGALRENPSFGGERNLIFCTACSGARADARGKYLSNPGDLSRHQSIIQAIADKTGKPVLGAKGTLRVFYGMDLKVYLAVVDPKTGELIPEAEAFSLALPNGQSPPAPVADPLSMITAPEFQGKIAYASASAKDPETERIVLDDTFGGEITAAPYQEGDVVDADLPVFEISLEGSLAHRNLPPKFRVPAARPTKQVSSLAPELVVPKLLPVVQSMYDAGPNRWSTIERGPEAGGFFQRGLSGSLGPKSRRKLNGAEEALSVLAGKPSLLNRHYIPLTNEAESQDSAVHRQFAFPLSVLGRSPTIPLASAPLDPGAGEKPQMETPQGLVFSNSIVSMGLFTPPRELNNTTDIVSWALNYDALTKRLIGSGFRFTPGSRGERFWNDFREIWQNGEWESGKPHDDESNLKNGSLLHPKLIELYQRYETD